MKAKLTVTIDEELIPLAKVHARSQRRSLSQLIEDSLRAEVKTTEGTEEPFSARWRGKFAPAQRDDERYRALAKRYR